MPILFLRTRPRGFARRQETQSSGLLSTREPLQRNSLAWPWYDRPRCFSSHPSYHFSHSTWPWCTGTSISFLPPCQRCSKENIISRADQSACLISVLAQVPYLDSSLPEQHQILSSGTWLRGTGETSNLSIDFHSCSQLVSLSLQVYSCLAGQLRRRPIGSCPSLALLSWAVV